MLSSYTNSISYREAIFRDKKMETSMDVLHHGRIQKHDGSNFDVFYEGWEDQNSKYHHKRAIIGPPAKRHLNGVSLEY